MVDDTDLVFKSIEGYVWGVRTWMKHQRQLDPIMGVVGWEDFMSSVKVLTWVPHVPRKATPTEVIERILRNTDTDDFRQVQLAFMILVLVFTFSRTECPCPKTYNGRDSFDEEVHWTVDDFDITFEHGRRLLWVRFKAIKQDKRMERPQAQTEEGDWACLSEIPNSIWCPVRWWKRLNDLHYAFNGTRRDPTSPMFVDHVDRQRPKSPMSVDHVDRQRALIYSSLLSQFKQAQIDVGVDKEALTALHGLRVRGYNSVKAACGVEVAVAHGLWRSNAFKRYDRFTPDQYLPITAAVAGGGVLPTVEEEDESEPVVVRAVGPPPRRMTRGRHQGSSSSDAPPVVVTTTEVCEEPDLILLPDGWEMSTTEGGPRADSVVFRGPAGEVVTSRADAWAVYDAANN